MYWLYTIYEALEKPQSSSAVSEHVEYIHS